MTSVENQAQGKDWALYQGDSAEVLAGLPNDSVSLSIFSPPFLSLFTYSASNRDLGNSKNDAVFWEQYGYISEQ